MKILCKAVLVCALWGTSVWGSASDGLEEIVFTDDQKNIRAHLARFERGIHLNYYVNGMTTFWKPENFLQDGSGASIGYCPATYAAYSLLLDAIASPSFQWTEKAQEKIEILRNKQPTVFSVAARKVPELSLKDLVSLEEATQQAIGEHLKDPAYIKYAIIRAAQRDMAALQRLYLDPTTDVSDIQYLLFMATFELYSLEKEMKQGTFEHLKLPTGLVAAVRQFSPSWDDILTRIQEKEVPTLSDPNGKVQALLGSLALLEEAQGAVATLSKAVQQNQEIIIQNQKHLDLLNPTIDFQEPLVRFAFSGNAFPFHATSGFLEALQIYFSRGDTARFGMKFSELSAIYKDNSVDACVADWFENACGAHVKRFLPLYENWRKGLSSIAYASWEDAFFFPILKHYLSWWTACTFAQSQGDGALMPREAFALAYTAWREVDMVVWTQNDGAAPEGFTLTTDDKKKLALLPHMKDVWNPPATLAIEETSS